MRTLFAVFHNWGWNALPIVKQTGKQTVCRDGSRDRHLMSVEVRCVLEEDAARRLVEKLKSSEALNKQERIASDARHQARVDTLCFAATEAAANATTQPTESQFQQGDGE